MAAKLGLGTQSYRMRILLLIYVTVMLLLLSTFMLFQSICQVIGFMFPPEILPVGLMYLPITLTLTTWGKNGFMVRIVISHQEQNAHSGSDLAVCHLVSGRA